VVNERGMLPVTERAVIGLIGDHVMHFLYGICLLFLYFCSQLVTGFYSVRNRSASMSA